MRLISWFCIFLTLAPHAGWAKDPDGESEKSFRTTKSSLQQSQTEMESVVPSNKPGVETPLLEPQPTLNKESSNLRWYYLLGGVVVVGSLVAIGFSIYHAIKDPHKK